MAEHTPLTEAEREMLHRFGHNGWRCQYGDDLDRCRGVATCRRSQDDGQGNVPELREALRGDQLWASQADLRANDSREV